MVSGVARVEENGALDLGSCLLEEMQEVRSRHRILLSKLLPHTRKVADGCVRKEFRPGVWYSSFKNSPYALSLDTSTAPEKKQHNIMQIEISSRRDIGSKPRTFLMTL